MTPRLVGWHTRVGDTGLRLLQLHLLWVLWTLRGGVVLGVFPATAAVHAVLRRDALRGEDDHRPLRAEYAAFWRAELAPANRLGYALVAAWAVVVLDRQLLATVDLGGAAPVLAGLQTLATLVLAVVTACAFPLAAHFEEGVPALLRRSLTLLLGRPRAAMLTGAAVGAVLCAYYVVPGLVPVFGVALPAWVAVGCLWHSGALPAPAAVPTPPAQPSGVGLHDRTTAPAGVLETTRR